MKIVEILKLSLICFGIIAHAQQDSLIVDFMPSHDFDAIASMFEYDRSLLGYHGNLDDIYSQTQVSKVIKKDNAIVGFCSYEPWDVSIGYIYHVVVDKDHRKKGYASKMMQFMIDDFVVNKVEAIELCVDSANKSALDLYRNKFGFISAGYDSEKYTVLTRVIEFQK